MKDKAMKDKIVSFLSSFPVQLLCRFILGGLFIYASIDKIANPKAFAAIVYNYKLLPDAFINFFAVLLPWLEIVAGIMLVTGIYIRAAAYLLSELLMVFIVAISFNLIRGLDFDCGCFTTVVTSGAKSDPVGLLIRDILLLIPGLVILFFYKQKEKKSELTPQPQL